MKNRSKQQKFCSTYSQVTISGHFYKKDQHCKKLWQFKTALVVVTVKKNCNKQKNIKCIILLIKSPCFYIIKQTHKNKK